MEMNAEATIKAKDASERIPHSFHVSVKHYHCDSGLLDTKKFRTSVQIAKQTITLCGVNTNHQNGKVERRIRDATEGSRAALLHAAHR